MSKIRYIEIEYDDGTTKLTRIVVEPTKEEWLASKTDEERAFLKRLDTMMNQAMGNPDVK